MKIDKKREAGKSVIERKIQRTVVSDKQNKNKRRVEMDNQKFKKEIFKKKKERYKKKKKRKERKKERTE